MAGKLKDVPLNTWILSLVSLVMVGSFTMNVRHFSDGIDDNEKAIQELQQAFNDSAKMIAELAKDIAVLDERTKP